MQNDKSPVISPDSDYCSPKLYHVYAHCFSNFAKIEALKDFTTEKDKYALRDYERDEFVST